MTHRANPAVAHDLERLHLAVRDILIAAIGERIHELEAWYVAHVPGKPRPWRVTWGEYGHLHIIASATPMNAAERFRVRMAIEKQWEVET